MFCINLVWVYSIYLKIYIYFKKKKVNYIFRKVKYSKKKKKRRRRRKIENTIY